MFAGKKIFEFEVNEKQYKIRYLKFEDAGDLRRLINSLIEGKEYISRQKKIDKRQSISMTVRLLKRMENKEVVCLVVETDGRVMGYGKIYKESGYKKHVGKLSISLRREIRGRGVGKFLMNKLIEEAKKNLKIEIIELEVFSENQIALSLYKKLGFKKTGVIRNGFKRKDKYFDRIFMVKYL